jgi:hypothetical protein
MVHVSSQTFGSSVEKGKIYYFKSSKLVSTTQAHFFIVIANPSDDLIIFTCCTSQFEKRARFIELNNIPLSTLVRIKPNNENGLKSDSYVDCNRYFQYSKAELIQMYELNRIEFIGYVQDSKLEEIRQGIIDSPLIVNEIKGLI